MLTLPPSVFQPAPPQAMPQEPISFIEPVARSRRAKLPLIGILLAITLVLIAGFYALTH